MKAVSHRHRSAKAVQTKPKAVQPRLRNAHEHQADDVANRFVAGQTGLSRFLTPAPAAGFTLPSSPGEPLAAGIRTELEQAFGAELGAVRIHRDHEAAAAARSYQARAFTTNTNVYFAAGEFEGVSPCGRELLAHEIAHVLQQTGRRSINGRLQTAVVCGEAPVQCDGDPYADDLVPFFSSGDEALTALNARHGVGTNTDENLKQLFSLVNGISAGTLPRKQTSTIGTRLIEIANAGFFEISTRGESKRFSLSIPARSYLIDCLKVCGENEHFIAAAQLINGDISFEVKSTFGPRSDFRNYLNDTFGEDWVAGAFTYGPMKRIWPKVFLNSFEQYALNPGRPRQALYGFKKLLAVELVNINGNSSDLIPSDRVIMAFALLDTFDKRRLAVLQGLDQALTKKGVDLDKPMQRMAAAYVLTDWLLAEKNKAESTVWANMLDQMQQVASNAAIFWLDVSGLRTGYNKTIDSMGFDLLTGVSVTLTRVFKQNDPTFKPLHDLFLSLSAPDGLYGLDAEGKLTALPAATVYEKRLFKVADTLGLRKNPKGNVLLTLQTRLIELNETNATNLKDDEARAIGLAIWLLLDFQTTLLDYSANKDTDAKKSLSDQRLMHRLKVAVAIARISQITGWADTLTAAARIIHGDDVPSSYLIVRGNWGIQSDTPLDQMTADFSTEKIFEQYVLTADHVVRFFHADMLRQITDSVLEQVNAVYKNPKVKLNAVQINKTIRGAGRPWRCVPTDAMLVLKPEQLKPQTSGALNPNYPSAFRMIKESEKTRAALAQLAKQKNFGAHFYFAALRDSAMPLFAWVFPDIAQLISHLRSSEPFQSIMNNAGLDKLPDDEWMVNLLKRAEAGDFKPVTKSAQFKGVGASEQLQGAISGELQEYLEGEAQGLESALREFTILNRRDRRKSLETKLKRYSADRSVVNFTIPGEVVKLIDQFRIEVRPEVDSMSQTALLVLSLGAELEEAFPEVRHAARIPPLFHYTLTESVKFADSELVNVVQGKDKKLTSALRSLLYANTYDSSQEEKFPDFMAQRDKLAGLAKRIEEARSAFQESMGFASDDGVTLKSLSFYPRIKPGRKNAFESGGDEWELVQVHRKFTYNPPLSGSAVTEKTAQPILNDGVGKPMPLDDRLLMSFLVNGLEYDVRANDIAKLNQLSEAIFYQTLAREMENLAEGIEKGAMLMMDIVELVPGVGQELMVARLTAQTAAFIGAELPAIAEALKKDPVTYIEEIGKKLVSEYLTLEGVITFVLLGQGGSPLDLLRRPRQAKSFSKPPHGKLARMIALLRKLGMRLADMVQWLQLRVSGPVRSLQSSIATRPKLGWVLKKGIDIGLWARDIVPPDLMKEASAKKARTLTIIEHLLPGETSLPENATPEEKETQGRDLIARIEDEVKKSGMEFKLQFNARLELLREAQLPSEIIPLELMVSFILDFFLSRLGAKVRIAKALLEETQPYQDLKAAIASALADEARGTAVDPNKYWRELIIDKVDGQFVEARNGLVKALYGLTDRVADETGIDAFRLERPDEKSVKDFNIARTSFPHDEIELAPRIVGEVAPVGSLAELPSTPGQPLAVAVRVAEERRFGHDLGHVRVHTDGESRTLLENLQANGATSGSHIFIRPGLTAKGGLGAKVLRHELTHVLQQAGVRPIGKRHDASPVRGRKKQGLLVDDLREAAAEAMAQADAKVAREPVHVDGGAEGLQLSLENAAVDVLKMFTEFHRVEEFEKSTGGADVPGAAVGVLVWHAVRKRLSEAKAVFAPFASPVAAHIAKHVAPMDLAMDLPKIAALAQKPIKGARGKKAKTELDFDRFVTLLEAVILGRTGVAMQLKAKEGKPPTLESVNVTYLHLGCIDPGTPGKTPLWDLALNQTPGLVGSDDLRKLRLEIHARLQALGPDPFIWKTGRGEYRFSEEFVESFGKIRASRKPDLVKNLPVKGSPPPADPSIMPKFKNEYLNPSGQSGIGLRIGLHGGHTGLEKQAGMDRESHHTTQYLLVQFFRNDNPSVKAWRPSTAYKGIHPTTGSGRAYFEGVTRGRLKLEELDKGGSGKRGSAMPAILVAADTHRRGQLHVERESQWKGDIGDPDSTDSQGRITQGFAIRAEFTRQQIKHVGSHDEAGDWEAKMKQPDAADKLHWAMTGTYHWMYNIMLPALENGLKTRELAYYRAVASRIANAANPVSGKLKPEYDLKTSDMVAVYARAKKNNDAVMGAAGWSAPG